MRKMATNLAALLFKTTGTPTDRPWGDHISDVVNVKDWGLVGDGVTDDAPALQTLANNVNGWFSGAGGWKGRVFFPPGTYKLNTTVTVGNSTGVWCGTGRSSKIVGNINGGLLNFPTFYVWLHLEDLTFENTHALGYCVTTGTGNKFSARHCSFTGYRCLSLSIPFDASVCGCIFTGLAGHLAYSFGLSVCPTCVNVTSCIFTGFDDGLAIDALANVVVGSYFYNNKKGLSVGFGYNSFGGFVDPPQRDFADHTVISGNSFKDNDIGIYVYNNVLGDIVGNRVIGTTSAPSGTSQYGIFVGLGYSTFYRSNHVDGTFTGAAWGFSSAVDVGGILYSCYGANSSGTAWQDPAWPNRFVLENCNIDYIPIDNFSSWPGNLNRNFRPDMEYTGSSDTWIEVTLEASQETAAALPTDWRIIQLNTGTFTLLPATGVTLSYRGSGKSMNVTPGQYGVLFLHRLGPNHWETWTS
jgi:hypothetical protein